jgi:hypothetical protein
VPLPLALQNFFSKAKETKDKDANLFSTGNAINKSGNTVWSLTTLRHGAKKIVFFFFFFFFFSTNNHITELEKLKSDASTQSSDITQIHNNLAQLYQLSHALESAIAHAQETVRRHQISQIPLSFDIGIIIYTI